MKPLPADKRTHRLVTQVLSFLGVLAVFFLAASLPELEFKPGQALAAHSTSQAIFPTIPRLNQTWLASICLSGMFVMVPLAILFLIISSEARRLFVKYARGLLLWFVFLVGMRYYILFGSDNEVILEQTENQLALPELLKTTNATGVETGAAQVYTPPALSDWQSFIVGFVVIAIVVGFAYYRWTRTRGPENELYKITLKTLTDISSGQHWDDAVIQCYAQMNHAVRLHRKLDRELSETPNEFAQNLTTAGLPAAPVQKLTRLFEKARYGGHSSQSDETNAAIECLADIAEALESSQ